MNWSKLASKKTWVAILTAAGMAFAAYSTGTVSQEQIGAVANGLSAVVSVFTDAPSDAPVDVPTEAPVPSE